MSPVEDGRVFFGNTGTEVTEAAVKVATRATGRDVIIACERAFHGRTLASIALTGTAKYREPYVNVLGEDEPRFASMNVARATFNDLASVEALFEKYPDRVAMVCLEPIQGEGGINPATREFLVGVRDLCRKHGALIGLDEIQAGCGRTGDFAAWTTMVGNELDADIIWWAKALGGGYPIAACVARGSASEHMTKGSHGSTFGGHPVACAAALATLQIMEEEKLMESAARQLPTLRKIAEADPEPRVREIRGLGAMIGMDLGDADLAPRVVSQMQDEGVLATLSGGTAVRCLLAFHAGETELREVWQAVRRSLEKVG
jgi:acetylornithine/succinyldiaminopimelate/putrescine aminotransferase